MTDGIMLRPGEGRRIVGRGLDATVKSTMDLPALTASFEIVIPPGYDVGAHVHARGEEIFYIVEGELDILAFDPIDRSNPNWYEWESRSGQRYLRGTPGAFMFVPVGVPHAFANPTHRSTKMFFQSSVPGGHEHYFDDLVALLQRSGGTPDPKDIADLRRRYDIEQLTPLRAGHPPDEDPEQQDTEVKAREHEEPNVPHDPDEHPGDHDHPHDHERDHDVHVHAHHHERGARDHPHDHGPATREERR